MRTKHSGKLATLAIIAIAAAQVSSARDQTTAPFDTHQCRSLLKKPRNQIIDEFPSYTPELQFTMYLCTRRYYIPPSGFLVDAYAAMGSRAVATIEEKMHSGVSDETLSDVLTVLEVMQANGIYDVQGNDLLMRSLYQRATIVKKPTLREIVDSQLAFVSSRSKARERNHP
jgi:hypothetical protein